jgi:hypothetical protein
VLSSRGDLCCVAWLFCMVVLPIFERCPTIFGGSTNFFWVSRSAWVIYENQSSSFWVTGHSPLELNEMVQYCLCG